MATQDGFDDDLFADLYADDDGAKHTTTTQADPSQSDAFSASALTKNPSPPNQPSVQPHADTDAQEDEYEEEDEDDIDINLGAPAAPQQHQQLYPDRETTPALSVQGGNKSSVLSKEDGKMFIGGLNWETTDESLKDYFSQFGEVLECTVMRDNNTGRSRGFGFLTFKDPKTVNIVMVKEHFLDGKIIDPKRAIPRDEQEKTSKIFVGGVSQETTDQEFREYFTQFGRVVDATLMMDKNTGRPRGFGFVTFESEAGVENCINTPLEIHGKPIEVKKAQPRGNLREEEELNRNNKFRKMDDHGMSGPGNMMGQMGGPNGMSPQVMAQYMQRMQQYFSMMQQQQMAMNRGMGQMNPAMWQNMQQQMMQMQQMQMMGRGQGGPGGPGGMMGGMNPAAMMGGMMGQNGANRNFNNNNNNGANANPNVGGGGGGNGNFDQQGGNMYNQQRRFNNQGQGNWNGGSAGDPGNNNNFDDSMQQNGPSQSRGGSISGSSVGNAAAAAAASGNAQSFRRVPGSGGQTPDPTNAPPANAPTGPKNAGKPGANYRGGGRGGNRGFHPYSR